MGLRNLGAGQIRVNPYDTNSDSGRVWVWHRVGFGLDWVRVDPHNPRFYLIIFLIFFKISNSGWIRINSRDLNIIQVGFGSTLRDPSRVRVGGLTQILFGLILG